MKNVKDFGLEIKSIAEDGTFEGWLSVYDVVDQGSDIVRPGAFTKTIRESGGSVPMLWQHNTHEPIGILQLVDKPEGLWVKGKLILEIQRAKEAYAAIKEGVIRGLSIGYKAIEGKTKMVAGIRNLFELKVYEGSIVTFPMLPDAMIHSVKAGRRHSAATLAAIEEAISKLQALREQGSESTSEEAAPPLVEAADKSIEPEAVHSLLKGLKNDLVSAIKAK